MKNFLFVSTIRELQQPLYDIWDNLDNKLTLIATTDPKKGERIEQQRINTALTDIADMKDYLKDLEKVLKWYEKGKVIDGNGTQ